MKETFRSKTATDWVKDVRVLKLEGRHTAELYICTNQSEFWPVVFVNPDKMEFYANKKLISLKADKEVKEKFLKLEQERKQIGD